MEHLPARGITCPQPVENRNGEVLGKLAGRPAAIVTFLDGMWVRRPTSAIAPRWARRWRGCISPGRFYDAPGQRALGRGLAAALRPAARGRTRCSAPEGVIADELAQLEQPGRGNLPHGVIHADLFPDNVFFLGDKLSGLIDFYFACNDALAYDVAICLNAWCFEPDGSFNLTKGRRLLPGYAQVRPLRTRSATPCRCSRAARRCASC